MFSGKLKIIIGSTYQAGNIEIKMQAPGCKDEHISLKSKEIITSDIEIQKAKATGYDERFGEILETTNDWLLDFVPIEQIKLSIQGFKHLDQTQPSVLINAEILPKNGNLQPLIWKVVSEKGIPLDLADITKTESCCRLTAKGDGKFLLRCMAQNTKSHPDIISSLSFEASGLGTKHKNPYELIIAGLYDQSLGSIKSGQEQGIAFNEPNDTVIYDHVDFGINGSDQLTISIFAFESKPFEIKVYNGDPLDKNTRLIDTLTYHKQTIWNVYQEQTYQLKARFTGVSSIALLV